MKRIYTNNEILDKLQQEEREKILEIEKHIKPDGYPWLNLEIHYSNSNEFISKVQDDVLFISLPFVLTHSSWDAINKINENEKLINLFYKLYFHYAIDGRVANENDYLHTLDKEKRIFLMEMRTYFFHSIEKEKLKDYYILFKCPYSDSKYKFDVTYKMIRPCSPYVGGTYNPSNWGYLRMIASSMENSTANGFGGSCRFDQLKTRIDIFVLREQLKFHETNEQKYRFEKIKELVHDLYAQRDIKGGKVKFVMDVPDGYNAPYCRRKDTIYLRKTYVLRNSDEKIGSDLRPVVTEVYSYKKNTFEEFLKKLDPKQRECLNEIEKRAIVLMKKHGVKHQFKWTRAMTRNGSCSASRINLNIYHALENDWSAIRNTILHEIAHALVGPGHGHRKDWQDKARELGVTWPKGRYRE